MLMDQENYDALLRLYPDETRAKVSMYAEFHPEDLVTEIPDPYYGTAHDFEVVYALCTQTTPYILQHIQRQL